MEKESSFYVTDRDFRQISISLKLTPEFISSIPLEGRVLEIGGGINQSFARGLKSLRPDLTVVTVDPTVTIEKSSFRTKVLRDDNGKMLSVYYTNKLKDSESYYGSGKNEDISIVSKERMQEASKTGYVASALAPELPFKDSTFNLIVDSFGPGIYLQDADRKRLVTYYKNLYRILKPGGEARIYPAIKIDETLKFSDDSVRQGVNNVSINYFSQVLKEAGVEFEVEFFDFLANSPIKIDYSLDVLMILRKK